MQEKGDGKGVEIVGKPRVPNQGSHGVGQGRGNIATSDISKSLMEISHLLTHDKATKGTKWQLSLLLDEMTLTNWGKLKDFGVKWTCTQTPGRVCELE